MTADTYPLGAVLRSKRRNEYYVVAEVDLTHKNYPCWWLRSLFDPATNSGWPADWNTLADYEVIAW